MISRMVALEPWQNAARLTLVFAACLVWFVLLFFLLRLALMFQHVDLLHGAGNLEVLMSFLIGVKFDLRMICFAVLPVTALGLFPQLFYRWFCVAWLTIFAAIYLFLAILEFEFYNEFQQRLNILVVQYLREDPGTVFGMLWQGFPIVRYLILCIAMSTVCYLFFRWLIHRTRLQLPIGIALPLLVTLLLADVMLARGTTRSGPPLRWGDAYYSENMFLNHLALNGSFTLAKALLDGRSTEQEDKWLHSLPQPEALRLTRAMLHLSGGPSADISRSAVVSGPVAIAPFVIAPFVIRDDSHLLSQDKPLNVVIILMESFSAEFVGALGNSAGVTPEFDKLSQQGVLFSRAFSNGTHTHQGTFATLSCFPNLPDHEYLMQDPEGMHAFSGLSAVLPNYPSTFVYNGDFSWDNQNGFFKNQGVQKFVGRDDYVDPVFEDSVWGVSDEDMFNRAEVELDVLNQQGVFLSYLQTLSNHMPYNVPQHDDIKAITDQGHLSERLTAMKYSDWALGQFFSHIKDKAYYDKTIFVILGDHGFGTDNQLTEVNLLRFHIPILIIAPGLLPHIDKQIASQVDIVPTILGLLKSTKPHQCWGQDLFSLTAESHGFAVIKPSGGEATVAIIKQDKILTFDHGRAASLYELNMSPIPTAKLIEAPAIRDEYQLQLQAYVQVALRALLNNETAPGPVKFAATNANE